MKEYTFKKKSVEESLNIVALFGEDSDCESKDNGCDNEVNVYC